MKNVRRSLSLVLLAGSSISGQPLLAGDGGDSPLAPDALTAPAVPAPAAPGPTITPNGIIALFGKPQVLFKVSVAPQPGQPASPEQSLLLGEGDRHGGITVEKIDAKTGSITFKNQGVIQKLTLTNGSAWSRGQNSATGGAGANTIQNAPRHRLVRQLISPDDLRAQDAPASDQATSAVGSAAVNTLPTEVPANVFSQPTDNSQKLASGGTGASVPETPSQSAGLGSPADDGDFENLTPAELAARDNAAGGDVPPPPPATGN